MTNDNQEDQLIVESHELSFEHLTFSVPCKKRGGGVPLLCSRGGYTEVNTIVDNISGHVSSGQMVSIMGPSGAGKTSLLNVLSLRATYGVSNGNLLLDGIPLNNEVFRSKCFFVGQFDNNWPHLTVSETCTFAATLFNNTDLVSEENKETNTVLKVIDDVGLTAVSDNRNSSLSGGQQRRLSLAIALLKRPAILFLDEITSGLDSASADKICKLLRRLVDERDIIVMCTIHQPSTKIFLEYFDKCILLSEGRLAYAGGTRSAEDYFERLGYSIPAMTNPSEFYMDLVNSDFGGTESVENILNTWQRENETIDRSTNTTNIEQGLQPRNRLHENSTPLSHSGLMKPSLLRETRTVLRRHFLMTYRDPVLYLGRCITALAMNSIFAFVYWNARKYQQDQAMAKAWIVVWYSTVPVMFGAVAVFSLNEEFAVIHGEHKNGMLRISSYIIAKLILTLPFVFIYAIFALFLPGWVLQSYPIQSPWFSCVLLWFVLVYLYESLAECFAIWIKDKVFGMLLYLSAWIASFLFSGLFLPADDIFWPLKLFYYGTPFSYYIRSAYYLLYSDVGFDACDAATNPSEPICVESGSGSDVLDSLHEILPLFENKDTFRSDILILLGMGLCLKVVYIAGMVVNSKRESIPDPIMQK